MNQRGAAGFGVWLVAACVIGGFLAGCASPPSAGSRETGVPGAGGPRFAASGPDARDYGAVDGYPIGDPSTFFRIPYLVGSLSHLDQVFEGRRVRRAAAPSALRRVAVEPAIRYQREGQTFTLDDYLARHPTTGLIIARDDTILVERYQYGRNDRHRFTSWSMAKTVTAMLLGIAIGEGRIRSVDDHAEVYVPALAGTEYGRTSLRDLLQMSSGVRFREEYTGDDDVARLARDTFLRLGKGGIDAVTPFNERVVPGGTRFSYASVETQVLGFVLTGAVGRTAAEYLEQKIWQPIGTEADATWLIDRSGQEATYCCLNAVLRDYARLGLLLAHDGIWRGRQVIPAAWIKDATSRHQEQRHLWPGVATPFLGYGYQTWIWPAEQRRFALLGVRGQSILVDPQSRLVMVQTSVRKRPSNDPTAAETRALWEAVVATLGK
jgi:CubicO group peptidase (beta-lactamase class C family)